MFSRVSDEWATPQAFFDALHAEFRFVFDASASHHNAKCGIYATREDDALALAWRVRSVDGAVWMNPPYSRVREFMAKAAAEAGNGCTVVCLVPARTDTRWWHESVWNTTQHRPRPGVEVRFVRGRLKFGGATAGAPFPSVVVVFRPVVG